MTDAPETTAAAQTAGKPPYRHLYLVDGSGYIFRAFFAIPPRMTSHGLHVNAAFGFTNMLIKLLRESDADGIAVIFDASGESFRNALYPAYKAQRDEPPDELVPQFAMIREATRAFNLPCIEKQGFEADDIIATYARQAREAGIDVTVVSSDKDLMQLVGGSVTMLDPIKNRPIGVEEVREKFGVTPDKVVEVQALAGDPTDNVPGVPGIGIKTAAQLIGEYGDLESLLARAAEIKQPKRREKLIEHAEDARISLKLVTLRDDVPLEETLDQFGLKEPEPETLKGFLERYEFRSILNRLADKLGDVVPDEKEAGKGLPLAAPAPAAAPGPLADLAAPAPAPAAAPGAPAYALVRDEAALEAWIAEAVEKGIVAVDTETTSLDPERAELVGVSLATAAGRACYLPLGHRTPSEGEADLLSTPEQVGGSLLEGQIPIERALALLRPLLADPTVLKVGQNLKYDMRILAKHGVTVAPFDDTMLLSYVLEGGLHGHGMDELSELHLGKTPIPYKAVCGSGKSQITFDRVALDTACDYAAEDADITLQLWQVLKPQLATRHLTAVYEVMERPLVPVLAEMERAGIKVDAGILRRMSNDFAQRLEGLEEEIYKLAGRRFTIGSPKQLGEILFDEMGLASQGRKGKSGALSTGADILEQLAAQGHELPRKVLDWRQLAKLKSTYTDALQGQITADGRVHTSYSQAVASTGRLSSNDPNLQNIPVRTEEGRKIRSAFIAEPGHTLLSVDYSQIELRLAADIAGVEALRQAFAEGLDIHAMTASQVFGVPLDQMDPATRRKAKAINFGIIYGISPFGLAQNLGIEQGEARAYIAAYFERFPGIRDYMDRMKVEAKERGYVTTLFGRRVHVPALLDKNPARRQFGERAAINAPIQGTAADIIKRAMIRVPPALERAGLKARMLLQVHDELLFEVPDDQREETAALVKEVMEGAAAPTVNLSVPLVADVGQGASWAEAH
ncbi:DNA polymerase I [Tistlia consotensis]|uniref:DNA polymerase I n=1 Tax=Tistlia consotensis USBA 355 TaxID=560819 RepID=A0A1Y6CGC6_9PROT|nr:DNA polymerase I [Tistlia consotensis]SMF63416.1 DNA polymerase I [Tistlia consotensis USBA 355]SNR96163.1 DNA polymerase I [Tistlia consotensis]